MFVLKLQKFNFGFDGKNKLEKVKANFWLYLRTFLYSTYFLTNK